MSITFVRDISSDLQLELEVAMALCEAVDTPRSLTVYLLLKNHEFEQYLELSLDPSHYDNPSNFADDHLVTEVLRKSPNLPLDLCRVEAAQSSFWISELLCFETNKRLLTKASPYENQVRRWLSRILGPLDRVALERIESDFGHGPGATATLRGSGLVPSDKFDKAISLTIDLYPYYKTVLGPNWHNSQRSAAEIVGGNKFTTVPKSAKTDRGICAEPTLNIYIQKGIGSYIRHRLKHFGIDLDDQGRNRELARRAYSEGLATIDLSSASDSLARNLVLAYFPEPWADLLCLARSHRVYIDGSWHELEKFSSMGNGYTFELESLIFYAVCASIVPRDEMSKVGVYGDDLILPSTYAPALIETLEFLGFSVNTRKSFLAGNFFESCGTDWFKGVNVRPFYLRGRKGKIPYELQIMNRIRLYSNLRMAGFACDSRFRPIWVKLLGRLPSLWKKSRVPPELGDTGVICSLKEAHVARCKNHIEAYRCRHVLFRAVNRDKRIWSVLLSKLRHASPSERPTLGKEPKRGFLGRPRLGYAIVSQWPDGLDWG